MREIKFRAWDKKNKCWFKTELEFYGFHLWGECTLLCPPNANDLQNLEVTQFTGLKDRNGKEIYEGDILTDNIVVKWRDDWASFALDKYGWMHDHYFGEGVNAKDIEIIGNIYENPDLLTTPRKD